MHIYILENSIHHTPFHFHLTMMRWHFSSNFIFILEKNKGSFKSNKDAIFYECCGESGMGVKCIALLILGIAAGASSVCKRAFVKGRHRGQNLIQSLRRVE